MSSRRKKQKHTTPGIVHPASPPKAPRWLRGLLPALVVAITFTAFLPALQNDFVNWDDDKNFLDNYRYRSLGSDNLRWMFTQPKMGHYHPLTWISLAVEYRLWGGVSAIGHHLGNMILHALNAGWVYLLALRLLGLVFPPRDGRRPIALYCAAAGTALLFGVHPLRVESVAWATERRDVLSAFFLLPCVLCYLRYATNSSRRRRWYAASVALLLLSLSSKAWGMTLPAVLLLLDFYPLRRLQWRVASLISPPALRVYLEKIPFVALAALAAVAAAWAQSTAVDTMKSLDEYGIGQRVAQAFYGLAFYLWKTVAPFGLSPVYEIPTHMNPLAARFVVAAVVVLGLTVALIALRKRWPAGLVLWLAYVITVSPVLGVAQSGPQLAADRYSYVSCIAWALLGGALLLWCWHERPRLGSAAPAAVAGGAAIVVMALLVLTWRQTMVWRDSWTLWEHALAVDPDCYNAHNNLGILLKRDGRLDEALEHYRASLALKPDNPGPLNNIGSIQLRQGKPKEALETFQRARELRPEESKIDTNIATCLMRLGRTEDAIAVYHRVVKTDPYNATALSNLGQALTEVGQLDEALEYLRRAIELKPSYAPARNNLAYAYKAKDDVPRAIEAFRKTVELVRDRVLTNPNAPERDMYVKACSNLGTLYARDDQFDQAIASHQQVLHLQPDRVFDLLQLGNLMMTSGHYDDAAAYFERVLQIHPTHAAAQESLRRARAGENASR